MPSRASGQCTAKLLWSRLRRRKSGGCALPFGGEAARAYARIAAQRRRAERPISQFDAQIAAIARSARAAIATRNVSDYEACGIAVLNPWNA